MGAEEQTTRPDKGVKRPSRHVKIMRRVVTPTFGSLAVAVVVLGCTNATMWKLSTEITASAIMSSSRYVVVDPNALTLLDQSATIAADLGPSQDEACAALGSSKDVAGWAASEKSYTRITGLVSWSELSTQRGNNTNQGTPTSADDVVSFKDSDTWTAVKCGTGPVSLRSKKTDASTVTIVDLGENVTNAKVWLHQMRSEVPDFAMLFYLSGGPLAVLVVLCVPVFAMPPHKRRKRMVEDMVSAVIEEEAPAGTAMSGKSDGANRYNRRHHATHRCSGRTSSQPLQSEATETPVIIDPSSRNLVADQQTGAESGAEPGLSAGDNESTSVTTPDKLQAYFSCLAQGVNTGDDSADDGQEES